MMRVADWYQARTFEALQDLWGPELSSLCAGFSVLVGTELHLTHAGDRYLTNLGDDTCEQS